MIIAGTTTRERALMPLKFYGCDISQLSNSVVRHLRPRPTKLPNEWFLSKNYEKNSIWLSRERPSNGVGTNTFRNRLGRMEVGWMRGWFTLRSQPLRNVNDSGSAPAFSNARYYIPTQSFQKPVSLEPNQPCRVAQKLFCVTANNCRHWNSLTYCLTFNIQSLQSSAKASLSLKILAADYWQQ